MLSKGDRVCALSEDGFHNIGDTGTVEENNSIAPWIKWDHLRERHVEFEEDLKLIRGGKKMKPEKIDKHAILQDSCDNLVDITNSLKFAEGIAVEAGKRNACTVYKLVPVSRFEPSVKKTKIK